jgi:hypothetical protein
VEPAVDPAVAVSSQCQVVELPLVAAVAMVSVYDAEEPTEEPAVELRDFVLLRIMSSSDDDDPVGLGRFLRVSDPRVNPRQRETPPRPRERAPRCGDSDSDDPVELARFLRLSDPRLNPPRREPATETATEPATVAAPCTSGAASQLVNDLLLDMLAAQTRAAGVPISSSTRVWAATSSSTSYPMPTASHDAIVAVRAEWAAAEASAASNSSRRACAAGRATRPDDPIRYAEDFFLPQLSRARHDTFLHVELPPFSASLDDAFTHAQRAIEALVESGGGTLAFKIGITRSPSHRFHRRDYGYFVLGYAQMNVLLCGSPNDSAELERRLISAWRGRMGCQNVAGGGEAAPPSGVGCWVYVAHAQLSDGMALEQRAAQNRRCTLSHNQLALAIATPVPDMLAGRR